MSKGKGCNDWMGGGMHCKGKGCKGDPMFAMKGMMMDMWKGVMKGGKSKGKDKSSKGKVAAKIAAGEPAFVGKLRCYNAEKRFGLISSVEAYAVCNTEVYAFQTVLESCNAEVGDTLVFLIHWNAKGQPQASGHPEILRIKSCRGGSCMAQKGTFSMDPSGDFGVIESQQCKDFFTREIRVDKLAADALIPGATVSFNIRLDKDYNPWADEVMPCQDDWTPEKRDLSVSKEDPKTTTPTWEDMLALLPQGAHPGSDGGGCWEPDPKRQRVEDSSAPGGACGMP